jgi:hypothetical protein
MLLPGFKKNGVCLRARGHIPRYRGENGFKGANFTSGYCFFRLLHCVKTVTFVFESYAMNIDLNHRLPGYLTEKNNIVTTILFTAGFALLFLNLYKPFGSMTGFEVSGPTLLLYSSGVILAGVLVVAISRIIMYQAVRRGMKPKVWQYLVWVAVEIAAMSVHNTSLTLLLPYAILWLYFSWRDSKIRLSEIQEQPDAPDQKPMIPLRDEKGVLRLSLKRSDIIYIQGSDNYVTIWYQARDKVSRFMLRNTLRTMEDELREESVIRCHRSYLVNIEKVKLIRREKDGLSLELDSIPACTVPVSRTYVHDVLGAFGHVD